MIKAKHLYRRQFFLGNKFLDKFDFWNKFDIGTDLFLFAHPELEVNQYTTEDNSSITITVIGFIINPYEPKKNNYDVLVDLATGVSCFNELQKRTYHLNGRWIIIYKSKKETKIFHDPCGMRQIFYTNINNQFYCGSQPTILQEVLDINLDKDPKLLEFIGSDQYEMSERAWIGNDTAYTNVKHLLPNHYLDLGNNKINRFWIDETASDNNDRQKIVEEVADLLKGSIEGLRFRYEAILAVTAGWDSRVLLAASKNYKDSLKYYVSTHNTLSYDHMDIRIPLKLSKKLNLNLEVIDNLPSLEQEFCDVLEYNISHARLLPKTLKIQYFLNNCPSDCVNINGNGSEIVKSFYGNIHPQKVDSQYIINLLGYKSYEYVERAIEEWFESAAPFSVDKNIELLDLFYWEQRMGNWGSMHQAEQDIAIEEFSPFNNRKLLMLLLSVDKKYRTDPSYLIYEEIVNHLWKEALSEPINPLTFKGIIKEKVTSFLPESIKTKIKKIIR